MTAPELRDRLLDRVGVEHGLFEHFAVDAPVGREIDEHGAAFVDGDLLQPFEREWLPAALTAVPHAGERGCITSGYSQPNETTPNAAATAPASAQDLQAVAELGRERRAGDEPASDADAQQAARRSARRRPAP